MSQAVADTARRYRVCAVNNTYQLAPCADALVAQDLEWWSYHRAARDFKGRKFSTNHIAGVERIAGDTQTNSGALAAEIVATVLGGRRILLFGCDMHGTHYHGPHPEPLCNAGPDRFEVFKQQFARVAEICKREGVEVLNCTPGSALQAFPFAWDSNV